MKSAYEIAMERLERSTGPGRKLTEEQKARIADIEKRFDSKIAEHRLEFDAKFAKAATVEELEKLRADLAEGLSSLEAAREKEKERIWSEA